MSVTVQNFKKKIDVYLDEIRGNWTVYESIWMGDYNGTSLMILIHGDIALFSQVISGECRSIQYSIGRVKSIDSVLKLMWSN